MSIPKTERRNQRGSSKGEGEELPVENKRESICGLLPGRGDCIEEIGQLFRFQRTKRLAGGKKKEKDWPKRSPSAERKGRNWHQRMGDEGVIMGKRSSLRAPRAKETMLTQTG